jgi:hypothetical protein
MYSGAMGQKPVGSPASGAAMKPSMVDAMQ